MYFLVLCQKTFVTEQVKYTHHIALATDIASLNSKSQELKELY
jgi:hypothetical protein